MTLLRLANAAAFLVMPFLLIGIINRVKSLWSGRKGPPIFQFAFDLRRLFLKTAVYSKTTTLVFRISPFVLLATASGSAVIAPLLGSAPLASFPFDFVWFAYVWGLGRVATMLAALDTGSSFEGMGAAREATFSTLLEPALFLVLGALCLQSGTHTLHEALVLHPYNGESTVIWIASVVALMIAIQVEASRMPVDDPSTHLELTMVHEVMTLDHSGPELASILFGSAIKLMVGIAIIATLLNPWSGSNTLQSATMNIVLSMAIAVVIGTVESLIARLRLKTVPKFILISIAAGTVALFATTWRVGGPG